MAEEKTSSRLFSSLKELQAEKITVPFSRSDTAKIDLLIDRGRYADREDFLAKAAAALLEKEQPLIDEALAKRGDGKTVFFVGVTVLGQEDFLEFKYSGRRVNITGYGALVLENGIDELILETVESIHVTGTVSCSERIRKAYLPTL